MCQKFSDCFEIKCGGLKRDLTIELFLILLFLSLKGKK